MHPGSGPSDRDNDVYFPPIREHLLAHEIAVCSFDKRGVGRSTGRWQNAGIVEQADDVLACIRSLLDDDAVSKPIGLFGHSYHVAVQAGDPALAKGMWAESFKVDRDAFRQLKPGDRLTIEYSPRLRFVYRLALPQEKPTGNRVA